MGRRVKPAAFFCPGRFFFRAAALRRLVTLGEGLSGRGLGLADGPARVPDDDFTADVGDVRRFLAFDPVNRECDHFFAKGVIVIIHRGQVGREQGRDVGIVKADQADVLRDFQSVLRDGLEDADRCKVVYCDDCIWPVLTAQDLAGRRVAAVHVVIGGKVEFGMVGEPPRAMRQYARR